LSRASWAWVAVKPQPEFEPFFRLNYEAYLAESVTGNNEVATPRGVETFMHNGISQERPMLD
jgi:hypothetical protein